MRRKTCEVPILPADMTGSDRIETEDRPQEAGLANAVATEDASHLAFFCGQADPAQRVAGAIIKIDRFDRQHCSAPEIDFDDTRMVLHMLDRAFRQHRAFVQYCHFRAEA